VVKVLVSVNEDLLRLVDRIAKAHGLSRSAYLSQLAEQDVARKLGPGARPAARRSLERLDNLFSKAPPGDTTAIIRAERDSR
jgi:hypothetical protein